jgi:hypothetical protein
MKSSMAAVVLIALISTGLFADGNGPLIQVIDNRVSIQADSVPLGRLLRLLDMATGMTSKVPPEFANRNLTIRFSGLSFDDAVRKIFEGVPLDYIVVKNEGIIVTAASQRLTAADQSPFSNSNSNSPFNNNFNNNQQPVEQPMGQEQPFFPQNVNPFPGPPQQYQGNMPPNMQQAQPAMIQTPFGPIPNPRAQQQPGNMPMAPPVSQPFGLANPASGNPSNPLGDGSIPTYNPNPVPVGTPMPNGIGFPVNGTTPLPGQVPRKPPGGQ